MLYVIEKADRPPWARTRTRPRLNALANTMQRSVRLSFLDGVRAFKKRINKESIYSAWLNRDYQALFRIIPLGDLPSDFAALAGHIDTTLGKSIARSQASLPAPINERLRFDMRNPRIRSYTEQRIGTLVVGIGEDTRNLIQSVITRSFDYALTPDRVAEIIRPAIGLYPKQAKALENYRANLIDQKVAPRDVAKMTTAYEGRLLDQRAIMIARTEVRDATNTGQMSVWNQASDQGLIDRSTAQKKIILSANACEDCEDLESQGPIPLDEVWTTTTGIRANAPFHPNCFCDLELIFGDTKAKMEASED